jgi:F420-non-reducing hydrogenase iron-sulfur subunit
MKGLSRFMRPERKLRLALFYCRNTPGSSEGERQALEKEYGGALRLFPLPCSGRMEPLHLMKALEEFADAAYLVTCPEGACSYFEGNSRAAKRVAWTGEILASIGLEKERVGMVANSREAPKTLALLASEIMEKIAGLGPSPVSRARSEGKRKAGPIRKAAKGTTARRSVATRLQQVAQKGPDARRPKSRGVRRTG